jgi:hypothetical protein
MCIVAWTVRGEALSSVSLSGTCAIATVPATELRCVSTLASPCTQAA